MGEITNSTAEKASKRSWFKGLKAEYKKIIWLDKDTLTRQSVAVIGVTIILGAFIFLLDTVIEYGIGLII